MAKQWFYQKADTDGTYKKYERFLSFSFFRELSVFCTWENGFRTAQSLGEKFDRKSPLPTNHNLHLDCKSWQNLDKHLCLYTVWPEFAFRSSAF